MEKFVTGKKAIWHSVELYKMEVKGMPFSEAQAFFPERSQEEMVFLYGITGGIPKKMAAVYGMDAEEAIREIYLDGQYATLMWPMQTMQMELRELSYYNRMLSCLAQGNQRVNQISREVNKPKDVVVPYMNTLMAMGMVTKETPITERTNRKKTRYSIVNTADLFWYRYMPKNMNAVYQEDETAIENLLETMLTDSNDYLKTVFINLCKEYLMNSGNDTLPFQIEEIGNWWMNDEENQVSVGFDIVGLGKSGNRDVTVYAMCYYDDKPIEIHELKALIELTKQLEQEGDVYYIIFSKAGFHENAQTVAVTIKNIMLISLDEILPKA
jgi:predicted transcriptional regulator